MKAEPAQLQAHYDDSCKLRHEYISGFDDLSPLCSYMWRDSLVTVTEVSKVVAAFEKPSFLSQQFEWLQAKQTVGVKEKKEEEKKLQ